jgi:hypothetical protein
VRPSIGLEYAGIENGRTQAREKRMNTPLTVIPTDPPLPRPTGRFVVDFGDQTATGLTAREVAELLESERNAHIKIYRIHRADADGRMELVGVDRARFELEDGFLFWRTDAETARADFDALRAAAAASPPPCRARVHLVRLPQAARSHLVALLYPAEYVNEMSEWLTRIGYHGGEVVEGGVSAASGYLAAPDAQVVERLQLWGIEDGTPVEQAPGRTDVNAAAS